MTTGITVAWGWLVGIPLFYLWVGAVMMFAVLTLIYSLLMIVLAMRRGDWPPRFKFMTQDEYDASDKKEDVLYIVSPGNNDAQSRT